MSLRRARAALGLAMAAIGGLSLCLGLLRAGPLAATPLGLPAHALASAAGLVLATSGILLVLFSARPAPEAAPFVPAHVAFVTRTARPLAAPEPAPLPARRAAPTRRPEEHAAMSRLDGEIRELTRQINKAGIKLATGQLSHQGYASYVEDLKKRRGDLEVSRVRLELHRLE